MTASHGSGNLAGTTGGGRCIPPTLRAIPERPMISSYMHPLLSSIMLEKDSPVDLIPLPPAREYAGGKVHTQFGDLLAECTPEDFLGRDPYPLPRSEDREGYQVDRHYDWSLGGLRDYLCVVSNLNRLGRRLTPGDRVFELGCASGRVLRHFALQGGLDAWGADINARHIEWIRLFMPPEIKAFQNTILPNLPLEDNSFDLVTGFSVFTHIDDLELAWIAEVRRILKPGGIAYLTIHSDNTWNGLKDHDWFIKTQLLSVKDHITEFKVSEELFRYPMDQERMVFSWPLGTSYNCSVFHTRSYIRSAWGRFFEILDIVRGASEYQDAVILRKPARG